MSQKSQKGIPVDICAVIVGNDNCASSNLVWTNGKIERNNNNTSISLNKRIDLTPTRAGTAYIYLYVYEKKTRKSIGRFLVNSDNYDSPVTLGN